LTSHSGFYVRWVAAAGHVPCSHDGGFFLFAQAFILRQPQMTRHGSSFSSIFSLFFLKFTTDFTSFVWLSTSAVSRFLFYFDFDFLHWGTQCRSLVQLNPLPFFLKKKQTTEIRDFFSRRRMVTGEFRTGHRAFRSGNPVAAELKRSLKNVTCCWRMAAAREGPRPAGGSLRLLEIGPEG
jgi:hypothetical protein